MDKKFRRIAKVLAIIFGLITGVVFINLAEAEAANPNLDIVTINDAIPDNYRVISGSTVYDTKTLDMWHWSAGYWEVGNAGSNKIRITDNEFVNDRTGQISPTETGTFSFSLPESVKHKLSEGKKIIARINATGVHDFNDLINPSGMNSSVLGNQLIITLKPRFNVIPSGELSFERNYSINVTHIPFIDPKYGCHLYSMVGDGLYEAQAYGWLDRGNKFSTSPPNRQITPAMVANAAGALKPGYSIRTSQGDFQSGSLNVGGPGVFKTGGAVGLHFEFPLSVTFYAEDEGEIIEEDSLPSNARAELCLPEETYRGHSVIAEDQSTYDTGSEIYSAKRAYAEGIASNNFRIITGGSGNLSKLTSTSQRATFNSIGNHSIRLRAIPEKGAEDTDTKSIKVLPTPAIKDYLGGRQKQNRKQVIDLKIATYPTSKLTKLYIEIERLSNGEKVRLTHKLGPGTNTLENSDSIKTRPIEILPSDEFFTNCRLEFLTKNVSTEEFKYTVYAKDDEGNTDQITKTFTVDPDRPPEAALNIEGPFIRGENSNLAEVKAEDKTLSDGDQIERTWYFRNTNAGQSEEEKGDWIKLTKASPGYADYSFDTGKEIGFSKAGVGLVEVKLFAKDLWTDETLEEYITDADRLTGEAAMETEVINIAPLVSLKPVKTKSAEITILTGGQREYDLAKSKAAQLEIDLIQQGIDPHINVEKMAPAASDGSHGAFKTSNITSPSGYRVNWLWYEDGGYIVDEEHFYRINATWPDDTQDGYPRGPYTINCWDFDASGTDDTKWSFTFQDDLLGQNNGNWQLTGNQSNLVKPYFSQDDSGKYLFFVACGTGKTIVLSKDTGSLLTVLDIEAGENCYVEGNIIYTFKQDGIYQISTTSGKASRIYNGNILEGKYRRIGGDIHFTLRSRDSGGIFRGLFNPVNARVKLQALPVPTLPKGNFMEDKCLGIDTDGKVITYSLIRMPDRQGDFSSDSYYYARFFVHDENNKLLFSSPPFSSPSLSKFTPVPIYNEEGLCNYIGQTRAEKNSVTATIYDLYGQYSKTGTVKGSGSEPSVADKIAFARELKDKIYICTGAEWVWVWQSGYNIYEERLKTFVFHPVSDTVKAGDFSNEVGIDLVTYEKGLHSDTLAAMQTTYGTPGSAYNLNIVTKWHQSLEHILNRYTKKNIKGEKDLNLLLIYDETNKESMYNQELIGKLSNKADSLKTKFFKIEKTQLSGDGLINLLGSAEEEGDNVLAIAVEKGRTGTLSREIELLPDRTYYYEYAIKKKEGDINDLSDISVVWQRPKGAEYGPLTYRVT